MFRILIYILLGFFCFTSRGQSIRVLDLNRDYEKYRKTSDFDIIHPEFDSAKQTWVADIQVYFDSVTKGMIGESYKVLKDKANRYGANAFTVKESDIYSLGDEKYINFSIYWIRMEDRDENLKLLHDNSLYLFGFLGYHQEIEGYEVAVNDEEFIMKSLSYRVYEFEEDEKVRIQLGSSLRGTTQEIRVQRKSFPRFYNFHLLRGSFKNAWIGEYDKNFGLFLTHILRKEE
ncbi:MAG: hypothetical protein WDZ35_04545 [Crocinitomicaceae bacterium]